MSQSFLLINSFCVYRDIDTSTSNLDHNELSIGLFLTSLVREGICPNFVIIRDIFDCNQRPLDSHWGFDSDPAPQEISFNGQAHANEGRESEHGL